MSSLHVGRERKRKVSLKSGRRREKIRKKKMNAAVGATSCRVKRGRRPARPDPDALPPRFLATSPQIHGRRLLTASDPLRFDCTRVDNGALTALGSRRRAGVP